MRGGARRGPSYDAFASASPTRAPESAAAYEQDVGGVDLQELLLRVLAPALRWHRSDGAFYDLEQRLLHALARDVAGDREVVGLAADLVDLVDLDDKRGGISRWSIAFR